MESELFINSKDVQTAGTKYFDNDILATFDDLVSILGHPTKTYNDVKKTQYEWDLVIRDCEVTFTVYDYQEDHEIKHNEPITWHIGAFDGADSLIAWSFVNDLLKKK